MIVLKFGGTSIRNAAMIRTTIDIAEKKAPVPCILVYSASNKTTDDLVQLAESARNGDANQLSATMQKIVDHHVQLCQALALSETIIEQLLKELQQFTHGLILLRETTPRSRDTLLAFGELLSTTIIYSYAASRDLKVYFHDSRTLIKTNDAFGAAIPDFQRTKECLEKNIASTESTIHILQGFIGSTTDGVCTTLGRGGSDYTASICAALLDAKAVEVWTDVHGIMTCDPRTIPEAQPISKLSYQEAAELAYFGAKILHPSTIQPAVEYSIPVHIKNTNDPDHQGTQIAKTHTRTVKALTAKHSLTLLQINSSRMLNSYGFLSRMFSVFNDYKISIDIVATSEVSVTVSVDSKLPESLEQNLAQLGNVIVTHNQTCLCLVGYKMWRNASLLARVFTALGEDIPITLISLGGSENNLTVVIPDTKADLALKRLHSTLFKDSTTSQKQQK